LDGVPKRDVKGRRFLERIVQVPPALLKVNWIPCFYNCRSEHGIRTFEVQVVREESGYLRDGLPGQENVSKIPVKDSADSLNEERLLVRGVVLVSAVISTQLNEEGNLPELTPHGLHVIEDSHNRIFAIGIVVNNFPKVCENTREELVSLHCYLRPCTRNIFKKLDVVLQVAILAIAH
jgi:hypothetical protein